MPDHDELTWSWVTPSCKNRLMPTVPVSLLNRVSIPTILTFRWPRAAKDRPRLVDFGYASGRCSPEFSRQRPACRGLGSRERRGRQMLFGHEPVHPFVNLTNPRAGPQWDPCKQRLGAPRGIPSIVVDTRRRSLIRSRITRFQLLGYPPLIRARKRNRAHRSRGGPPLMIRPPLPLVAAPTHSSLRRPAPLASSACALPTTPVLVSFSIATRCHQGPPQTRPPQPRDSASWRRPHRAASRPAHDRPRAGRPAR